jgi:hypothetical protein
LARGSGTSSGADDRDGKMQVALQLDHRLMELVDAAARRQATSRVALIAAWLNERLQQRARNEASIDGSNLAPSWREVAA